MTHIFLFTPDTGIVVLTLSAILIFLELNRTGMILPGSLGLLGVLLVVNSWRQWQLSAPALLLLLAAALLCVWQLRHTSSPCWTYLSGVAFSAGFAFLVKSNAPVPVHMTLAVCCGWLIGASASVLARIAHRARQNKGLN